MTGVTEAAAVGTAAVQETQAVQPEELDKCEFISGNEEGMKKRIRHRRESDA